VRRTRGVLAPGIGRAALRDDGSECGFASTFTQGAGVTRPGVVVITYSRPSAVKPPNPLKKTKSWRGNPAAAGASARWVRVRERRGMDASTGPRRRSDPQCSPAVSEDGASDRLEQNAILGRDLIRRPDKDTAGPVGHVGFDTCGNQPHDLFVQELPVAGVILIQIIRSTARPLRRQYACAWTS